MPHDHYQAAFDAVINDPRYLANLDWGDPRPTPKERARPYRRDRATSSLAAAAVGERLPLRLLIHTHDTFKARRRRRDHHQQPCVARARIPEPLRTPIYSVVDIMRTVRGAAAVRVKGVQCDRLRLLKSIPTGTFPGVQHHRRLHRRQSRTRWNVFPGSRGQVELLGERYSPRVWSRPRASYGASCQHDNRPVRAQLIIYTTVTSLRYTSCTAFAVRSPHAVLRCGQSGPCRRRC